MRQFITCFDTWAAKVRPYSLTFLRIGFVIVFFWFGLLKLIDVSPVAHIINAVYAFLPEKETVYVIGMLEVGIALGVLFKKAYRFAIFLLCVELIGIFLLTLLSPSLFFRNGNMLYLTLEGEFVVKNFVLLAAGIVLATQDTKHKKS